LYGNARDSEDPKTILKNKNTVGRLTLSDLKHSTKQLQPKQCRAGMRKDTTNGTELRAQI
jgi:hypothetical protein